MNHGQFSQEQSASILHQAEIGEQAIQALCREHSVTETTFYRWRKVGMTDVTGCWGYSYDAANRQTQLSAPNGTTGYGYDNANRRTSMTVSGVTGSWTYGYDPGNRLTATSNPYSETATNVFDAANRLTSTTNGNSSVTTNVYDSANRTTSVTHKTSGSVTLANYQYSYDSASNVSSRTDSDGTVTTFGYDASDQLTSEVRDNSHSTSYSIAFVYDHNANRTSKVQGGVTTLYSYDNHDKLTAAGSKSYGYDLNGNCTSVTVGTSVTSLTYDIENRVVGISYPGGASNSFAYNGDDMRVKKVDSSGTQNYVTDGSSPASAVLKDGNAVYTPGLSERRGSASKFYHADALGSTRGITDSTQSVTDSQLYDAFGNTVSRTGTTPTPFGFVGKAQYQSDSDSSLQLLGHRYYDPSIGRFLSSDPIQDGDNWYAYCDNNPLDETDPEGLDAKGRVRRATQWADHNDEYKTIETIDPTDCGRFVKHVIGPDDTGYPDVGTIEQHKWIIGKGKPKWKIGRTDDPGYVPQAGDIVIAPPLNGNGHTGIIVGYKPGKPDKKHKPGTPTVGIIDASLRGRTPGHPPQAKSQEGWGRFKWWARPIE